MLRENDKGKVTALVLLDLSAAFDTVDHDILLSQLQPDVGVYGSALSGFRSYLSGRSQSFPYDDRTSSSRAVTCGVPRGSVLGPFLCWHLHASSEVILQKQHDISYLCCRHTPVIRS